LKKTLILLPALLVLALTGCKLFGGNEGANPDAGKDVAVAKIQPSKNATTQPSNQNVGGDVKFVQQGDAVRVTANLTGLSPGKHGFHIHQNGDLSAPDLSSAGSHYNPHAGHHGDAHGDPRHAGDLGNLMADGDANAKYDQTIPGLTVAELIGKSVIIHAKEDDLKSDPAGNSGGRVAGGVIEKQ
jgi:Cu-Zn family superoxide dismutase